MRAEEPCYVFAFYTTADAIAFDRFCTEHQLPGRLIPLPREISAECGMSWRVPLKNCPDDTLEMLKNTGIRYEKLLTLTI